MRTSLFNSNGRLLVVRNNLFQNNFRFRSVFQRHEVPVPNEGAVGTWVSDVYRFRSLAPVIDTIRWGFKYFKSDLTYHEDSVLSDLRDVLEASGVSPCNYFPRFKEGGVVVYFRTLEDAQQAITYFNTNTFRGKKRSVFLIEGTPWLEDMLNVTPSVKVKVTPATPKLTLPLSEEELYSEMRVYGTLTSMEFDSKQEFALFTYRSEYSAISARVCLHMKEILEKRYIRVTYEKFSRFSWISKILANPRVTVPVIAIGGSILSYLLIDPVRLLNVVRTLTSNKDPDHAEGQAVKKVEQENPDTKESEVLARALETAPTGSGMLLVGSKESRKMALSKVTKNRWFVVSINLNPDGKSQVTDTIQDLCTQIGFFPTFNNLSRLFDYFQAMIPGTKAATNQGNVEEQLESVLGILTSALKIVSRTYPNDGRPFPYAVVVLDFKSTMSEDGNPNVVPLMQTWAMEMMKMKLAHVVVSADSRYTVITDSSSGSLKNHSYVVHEIDDISEDQVKEIMQPLFPIEMEKAEALEMIEYLIGEQYGRFQDYEDMMSCPEEKAAQEQESGGFFSRLPFIGSEPNASGVGYAPIEDDIRDDAMDSSAYEDMEPAADTANSQQAEDSGKGWWDLLEQVVLKRSRDFYSRYLGAEREVPEIPMEGHSLDTLVAFVYKELGGRLPDVMKFKQRMESTRQAPSVVLRNMKAEATADVLSRGFGKKLFSTATPGSWSQVQLWKVIKAVVATEGKPRHFVPLNSVMLSVFKGDKGAFQALLGTGVIRVEESEDGMQWITAGSPLLFHCFKTLVSDKTIWKGMEKMLLDAEYKDFTDEALNLEVDLNKMGKGSIATDMDYEGREGLMRRKSQVAKRLGELAELINANRKKKAEVEKIKC